MLPTTVRHPAQAAVLAALNPTKKDPRANQKANQKVKQKASPRAAHPAAKAPNLKARGTPKNKPGSLVIQKGAALKKATPFYVLINPSLLTSPGSKHIQRLMNDIDTNRCCSKGFAICLESNWLSRTYLNALHGRKID